VLPGTQFVYTYVQGHLGLRTMRMKYFFDIVPTLEFLEIGGEKITRATKETPISEWNEEHLDRWGKLTKFCDEWFFDNVTKGGITRAGDLLLDKNKGFFQKCIGVPLNLSLSLFGGAATLGGKAVGKVSEGIGARFRRAMASKQF
jgi:hypothetical protein